MKDTPMPNEVVHPEPMSITKKIRVAMQSTRIEVVIILGVILIISCMILIIYRLATPGEISGTIVNKLLDQLNTLEGALIAWGTSLLGAVAARIRVNGNKKDKEGE